MIWYFFQHLNPIMVYKAMLQLSDQDTSSLFGGSGKTITFTQPSSLGNWILICHCRVMSNMIDMCVFMDYLFIYLPFLYIL